MAGQQDLEVAVLLATYNGEMFIDEQIKSLQENTVRFTLHWLDDHSTDGSLDAVRASAHAVGIELREWHQTQHEGLAGAYFRLLECVEADIYLFCDQDDIWQPGKIDATVSNLLQHLNVPTLCYSDPMVFGRGVPGTKPLTQLMGIKPALNQQESRLFMYNPATGHTIGFTRPLRELFLLHMEVARTHAFVHDWWMYLIALASGTSHMLSNVPTTLYRLHGGNAVGAHHVRRGLKHIPHTWRLHQMARRWISRQAQGFIMASETLPQGPKLDRLLRLARLTATLERRQSPAEILRLARSNAMPASRHHAIWLAATSLWSDVGRVGDI
jgi:rhamnosyltransferase